MVALRVFLSASVQPAAVVLRLACRLSRRLGRLVDAPPQTSPALAEGPLKPIRLAGRLPVPLLTLDVEAQGPGRPFRLRHKGPQGLATPLALVRPPRHSPDAETFWAGLCLALEEEGRPRRQARPRQDAPTRQADVPVGRQVRLEGAMRPPMANVVP